MKLNQMAWANASAAFMGIVYLFCGFAIALFPGVSRVVTRSWFHGIDMEKVWSNQAFQGNFLLGLVTAVGLSWLAGWIFAWLYNKLTK